MNPRIRTYIALHALVATIAAGCAQPEPEQATPSTTEASTPAATPPAPAEIDWAAVDSETVRHFQALLRLDTRDPPGNELPAADYLMGVLQRAGIEAQTFALEPNRPNVVARIRGNGSRPPLLVMAHTDVVNVDTTKWRFPPFSAARDSGYVYGRGAVDDKDNLAASLMLMLLLKRQQIALDRDVIFLAEAGEEGSTRVGIQYMVNEHYPAIEAEYCLAEGGNVTRVGGQVRFAAVATTEKIPRAITLTARGTSGHGSVPLESNAVLRLSAAVAKFATWRPPVRLNETTREYFTRLAPIASPTQARYYRDIVSGNQRRVAAADAWFRANEPRHASMLRTSIAPTMLQGGYRVNVIPSEASATLDVRMMPDEDTTAFLATVRDVVADPNVEVAYAARDVRPGTPVASLDSEAFRAIEAMNTSLYGAVTLPTMLTGATDMAYLRAKGMQCYGIGPAVDEEDGPRGYGAHSDQERILEAELARFTRYQWEVVRALAGSR
ncbi:MAG TPA: M20/M25/M40 family metallo-hydrolase [Gemmatimonadaceae bacterium]|nr:M20/M25/M40 family metallo-hydrolase [Gemmatimonadaceae bacterium]